MVDEWPRDDNQNRASPYFCSGRSPVTNSASVHWARLPASAIASTPVGLSIETVGSLGSFLYVQYEQVSRHRLIKLIKTLREYVTIPSGLVKSRTLPAASTNSSVGHSEISCTASERLSAPGLSSMLERVSQLANILCSVLSQGHIINSPSLSQ